MEGKPLIITAAITGGGAPKARSPHQPATPEEIVDDAVSCAQEGAAIIHIHPRDGSGQTTTEPADHIALRDAIRARGCDAIISFSAGDDGGRADHEARLRIMREGGGEMASLSFGSFNAGSRLYDNRLEFLERGASEMKARQICPEVEILDTGNLHLFSHFVDEGRILTPCMVQLGFGIPGTMFPEPALLEMLVRRLPEGVEWGVVCQSPSHRDHLRMTMTSFLMGGHVRTGMEDVTERAPGLPATSNAELVSQWVSTSSIWHRPVATPEQARSMLGIPSAHDAVAVSGA